MTGLRFVVASNAALSGDPTGTITRAPVFDCLSVIRLPS